MSKLTLACPCPTIVRRMVSILDFCLSTEGSNCVNAKVDNWQHTAN